MEIRWTESAISDLRKVFIFYSQTLSVEKAQGILNSIFEKTKTLKLGTKLWQEEQLLKHLKLGHRYLIS